MTATPYERRPVRMRYSLTDPGRRLAASIASLAEWGAAREGQPAAAHATCGSALQTRPWCPTCDEIVTGEDADELIWC